MRAENNFFSDECWSIDLAYTYTSSILVFSRDDTSSTMSLRLLSVTSTTIVLVLQYNNSILKII